MESQKKHIYIQDKDITDKRLSKHLKGIKNNLKLHIYSTPPPNTMRIKSKYSGLQIESLQLSFKYEITIYKIINFINKDKNMCTYNKAAEHIYNELCKEIIKSKNSNVYFISNKLKEKYNEFYKRLLQENKKESIFIIKKCLNLFIHDFDKEYNFKHSYMFFPHCIYKK